MFCCNKFQNLRGFDVRGASLLSESLWCCLSLGQRERMCSFTRKTECSGWKWHVWFLLTTDWPDEPPPPNYRWPERAVLQVLGSRRTGDILWMHNVYFRFLPTILSLGLKTIHEHSSVNVNYYGSTVLLNSSFKLLTKLTEVLFSLSNTVVPTAWWALS